MKKKKIKIAVVSASIVVFLVVTAIILFYPKEIKFEYLKEIPYVNERKIPDYVGWYQCRDDIMTEEMAIELEEMREYDFTSNYYLVSSGRPLKKLRYNTYKNISRWIGRILHLSQWDGIFSEPIYGGKEYVEDKYFIYKMNKTQLESYAYISVGNMFTGQSTISPPVIVEYD